MSPNPFDLSAPPVQPADFLISPHLRASEIRCPCGCQFGMHPGEFDRRLGRNHEAIRQEAGRRLGVETPLRSGSGCRCPAHNRALRDRGLKAAYHSDHLKGRGLDIHQPAAMSAAEFGAMVLELHQAGKLEDISAIGFYSWGVHLSVGSLRTRIATWGKIEEAARAELEPKAKKPAEEKPKALPAKPKPAKERKG